MKLLERVCPDLVSLGLARSQQAGHRGSQCCLGTHAKWGHATASPKARGNWADLVFISTSSGSLPHWGALVVHRFSQWNLMVLHGVLMVYFSWQRQQAISLGSLLKTRGYWRKTQDLNPCLGVQLG